MLAKKQKGFTLIELVMVIVILGVLAATALPKFVGLERSSKIAALKGMKGGVKSAALMIHAQATIDGVNATKGWLDTNQNGKNTTADGDVYTFFLYPRALDLKNTIDLDGFDIVVSGKTARIRLNKVDNCEVKYTEAASVTTPPTYEQIDTGC